MAAHSRAHGAGGLRLRSACCTSSVAIFSTEIDLVRVSARRVSAVLVKPRFCDEWRRALWKRAARFGEFRGRQAQRFDTLELHLLTCCRTGPFMTDCGRAFAFVMLLPVMWSFGGWHG